MVVQALTEGLKKANALLNPLHSDLITDKSGHIDWKEDGKTPKTSTVQIWTKRAVVAGTSALSIFAIIAAVLACVGVIPVGCAGGITILLVAVLLTGGSVTYIVLLALGKVRTYLWIRSERSDKTEKLPPEKSSFPPGNTGNGGVDPLLMSNGGGNPQGQQGRT